MHGKLRDIDVWIRRRLRGCIWSRKRSGEETESEYEESHATGNPFRHGLCMEPHPNRWAVACSPILSTTITNARLERRGSVSMLLY
ncbi:MAG: hypothetical protein U5R06_22825 [candidate division KSB1 bacterium]|nr:hypothetical protein [candidate division KSB1 bacterium]